MFSYVFCSILLRFLNGVLHRKMMNKLLKNRRSLELCVEGW